MIMKATPNTRPRILFVTTADGLKSEDRLSIFHTNRDTTYSKVARLKYKALCRGGRRRQTNDNCLSNVLVGYALLWEVPDAPTGKPG